MSSVTGPDARSCSRHAEAVEVLLRQVQAAAVEVLADVADEVGQLEGLAERGRRRRGLRGERAQHRQHHQADDHGRPVRVDLQVRVRRVLRDGDVHLHRGQEGLEQLQVDAERVHGVGRGVHHGVGRGAALEVAQGRPAPVDQAVGVRRGRVDQLVGPPGEAVERPHVRPLGRRQQPGRQVVRLAVLGRQPPRDLVARPQPGLTDSGRRQGVTVGGGPHRGILRAAGRGETPPARFGVRERRGHRRARER